MVHIHTFRKIMASCVFAFFLSSCTTEIDWNTQIDKLISGQSYVIPIGETTLTINDILVQIDSSSIDYTDKNYVFFKYNDTIVWDFKEIADLQSLGKWNEKIEFNGVTIPFVNNTVEKDFPHTISFDFNTDLNAQQVVQSEMNSAKVEIQVIPENIEIEPQNVKITTFFNSNELVFLSGGDATKGSGSTFVFNPTVLRMPEVVTLNPFTLYTPNNLSELHLNVKVEVTAGNTPIVINPNSNISLTYRIFDVDPKVYFGKFKPVISVGVKEKTVDMTPYIMQLPANGIFKLAEPSISMELENNSGLKMNLTIDSIKAYRENDLSFSPIFADFSGSKSTNKIVERVKNYGDSPAKSSFVLDYTLGNGNISKFFDRYPLPNRLMYKFQLSNARVDSDPLDFMIPNGNVKAHIAVKVPLKLNANSSFEFTDTLKNIDLDELINSQVIDKMTLILRVTNNMPLQGKLSLKFLDINNKLIENLKLLSDSIVKAPSIDDNGMVVDGSSAISDLKVVIDNSQLENLRLTKNIAYIIKVESDENRKITLQNNNFIKLKLGKYSKGE